jgi:hypothetical protein
MQDTVRATSSVSLTVNGNDTLNAGAGSGTMRANAADMVVNGSTSHIYFDGGSGTSVLSRKRSSRRWVGAISS